MGLLSEVFASEVKDLVLEEPVLLAALPGGQSGDQVNLLRDKSGVLSVQKRAGSPKSHLGEQAKKLLDFPASNFVQVPQILSPWDGRGYSMEYIPSRVLGEFLNIASHKEVNKIGEALMGFVSEQLDASMNSSRSVGESEPFKLKIDQLLWTHKTNEHRMKAASRLQRDSFEIPLVSGFNHGDFSFENILIERQTCKVWLIDPISSPVESPLIDLGRFLLDLDHGWWPTFRNERGSEKVARNILLNSLRSFTQYRGIDNRSLSFFKRLAALRILPYTKDVGRAALLDEALSIGQKLD